MCWAEELTGARRIVRGDLLAPTSVCTKLTLWDRSSRTQLNISTTPSFSAMSSMMSMAIKHPVLPAPALEGKKSMRVCMIKGAWRCRALWRRKWLHHRHSCLVLEAAPLSLLGWFLCVAQLAWDLRERGEIIFLERETDAGIRREKSCVFLNINKELWK